MDNGFCLQNLLNTSQLIDSMAPIVGNVRGEELKVNFMNELIERSKILIGGYLDCLLIDE